MPRILLDTNIFIGSAYNAASASRRLVEAVRRGDLTLVVSPAIRREFNRILPRAVRKPDELARIDEALARAEEIRPHDQPRIVPEDPDDDKFLAAALAARAEALITNDEHLLAVGPYKSIPILLTSEFLDRLAENADD